MLSNGFFFSIKLCSRVNFTGRWFEESVSIVTTLCRFGRLERKISMFVGLLFGFLWMKILLCMIW